MCEEMYRCKCVREYACVNVKSISVRESVSVQMNVCR